MIVDQGGSPRKLKHEKIHADIVVCGGGFAGVCAAIAAAREGMHVVLVQDRPVLGGNASSEVRLWILGATSHMGNNNRWAREGGLVDEILSENMYRNKEGNPLIFDTILLEKVNQESRLQLLLNTAVYEVQMDHADKINALEAYCSQNQTRYSLVAQQFIDASGDGIVAFLAGAAFRMGAEHKDEFDEAFAPDPAYGELLGHSIYFYTKNVGIPVHYTPPAFAIKDITAIPRFRSFNTKDHGCKLWWIEYGGRLDTIHDSETIKWELWKIVYGVWDHIKNSGQFPESECLTLEWVGTIPGKRESRRFEGDYILTQKDIVQQREAYDAIAYGGWSIDLHPADGVYSDLPGCNQWHSKGIYPIPYRCVYSRNIKNLFLAGRIISASHVAFGSTRVMATGAAIGQAVGTAASICIKKNKIPRDLSDPIEIVSLQQQLLSAGVFLPGIKRESKTSLAQSATIEASSSWDFTGLHDQSEWITLEASIAQMIPCVKGRIPRFTFFVYAKEATSVIVQLRLSEKVANYTPEHIIEEKIIHLFPGKQEVFIETEALLDQDQYVYLTIQQNETVEIAHSDIRMTGILSLYNQANPAVSNFGKQDPPSDIGVDAFEFWCPQRRPSGKNIAFIQDRTYTGFGIENILNGMDRPYIRPNAWVADLLDPEPTITLNWDALTTISRIELYFDNDFDHPMETVLMGHPEHIMPFCVQAFHITDEYNNAIASIVNNHQALCKIDLPKSINVNKLCIKLKHPAKNIPASLFAIRCF